MAGKPWRRRTSIQISGAKMSTRIRTMPVSTLDTLRSLSAEASKTKASAAPHEPSRRPRRQVGAHPDPWNAADQQRRGQVELEVAEDEVARAAEATSGTACTRSVPTSSLALSVGYSAISAMMISDPEPTDVMPTTIPPRGRRR